MLERKYTQFRMLTLWSIAALLAVLISAFNATHGAQAAAPSSLYTFTVFTNSSQSNMYVYQSTDGLNFAQVAGPAYTPPSGLVRDPSIMHYSDGLYYMTYTTNWTGNTLGIASSPDRLHWTFLENVTLPSSVYETWAPEWFKDTDGSINIIVNLNSTNAGDSNFIPNKITAQNSTLTSWSSPTPLRGISPNYIDTFLVKIGSTYHAFVKNETTKYIEHATASNLTGPYTFVGTGNWAGWGAYLEGPAIYQLDNGNWRILMDGYSSGQYFYSDSSNNFQSWTAKSQLPGGLSGFVRHGTVLKETVPSFSTTAHYKIVNRNSGKLLDVANASKIDGTALDQWTGNGGTNQQWQLVPVKGGFYELVNVNSGKLADVGGGSTADAASVIQWTNNGGSNQEWQIVVVGSYYKIINVNSGKVLDVAGSATVDGAQVIQYTDHGGTNQQWSIVQV